VRNIGWNVICYWAVYLELFRKYCDRRSQRAGQIWSDFEKCVVYISGTNRQRELRLHGSWFFHMSKDYPKIKKMKNVFSFRWFLWNLSSRPLLSALNPTQGMNVSPRFQHYLRSQTGTPEVEATTVRPWPCASSWHFCRTFWNAEQNFITKSCRGNLNLVKSP
jgi:hypothetical protein